MQAFLWTIREIKCKYPVEISGVDNDSTNRTAEIYEKSGIVKNNNEDARILIIVICKIDH